MTNFRSTCFKKLPWPLSMVLQEAQKGSLLSANNQTRWAFYGKALTRYCTWHTIVRVVHTAGMKCLHHEQQACTANYYCASKCLSVNLCFYLPVPVGVGGGMYSNDLDEKLGWSGATTTTLTPSVFLCRLLCYVSLFFVAFLCFLLFFLCYFLNLCYF